jgi:hypothetical protein
MAESDFQWQGRRAALLVAHPGHELRVHHWMELSQPLVLVLTDGTGHTGKSRVSSTLRVLQGAGARAGSVCGRFTDAEFYSFMLRGDRALVAALLRETARILEGEGIEVLVHDAIEGYNPSHDLCWHFAGAAALLAERSAGRDVHRFDFLLTGPPDECPRSLWPGAVRISLDKAALARKLAAAETYPELKMELETALGNFGPAAFATEWLRPAQDAVVDFADSEGTPFYERHGESRRASGLYSDVIRRKLHVLPLAKSLWEAAGAV